MQMVSTSQAIAKMREAGLLTISLVTDPTYGGVAASFATNTDIVIAESGARMGFAGPRVIKQTIGQELPDGFQSAEFLLSHGQVDIVRHRQDLRECLSRLLAVKNDPAAELPRVKPLIVRDPDTLPSRDPWETVGLARHLERPTMRDYLARTFDSFVELRGDRLYGDCPSIIAGIARLDGLPLAVVGHQKGSTTRERVARNFGMPRPEGYRKALRIMSLAATLKIPVVTLVDTPGAYPGIDAEERGQALAIARNVLEMSRLPTPVVSVVTGEGGSGGALALAVADTVLVLENSIYSVISPEGCSAILWKTAAKAPEAARALRIVPNELLRLGVVDGVIPEPRGGAQADHRETADRLRQALLETLPHLLHVPPDTLVERRESRFRDYGRKFAKLTPAETDEPAVTAERAAEVTV
jgi:acyl-CoA carboxylase subunit beta